MGTYSSSPGSSQLTLFSDADKEKFTKLLTDLKGKVNSSSCIHSLPLFFLFTPYPSGFCLLYPSPTANFYVIDCASHYPSWRELHPDRADRFVPGGFGENFVTDHMNERNVCIGDIMAVGDEVLIQVSLPRMPCFKLNHSFAIKKFAPTTTQTSRTGWYYRVLKEGSVKVGDDIKLVERKWPEWTIHRLQEYLHRNPNDEKMNEEISQIEALGPEAKKQFENRVAKAKRKDAAAKPVPWRDFTLGDFKLVSRKMETPRIVSLKFEVTEGEHEDADKAFVGAHAKIKLPNGLIRKYSITGVAGEKNRLGNGFELGISLDENSRGGSKYIHENLKEGDMIQVDKLTPTINPPQASTHIFIAGGIGITAFLSLAEAMKKINFSVLIHYGVRSRDDIPFKERLDKLGSCVKYYVGAEGDRVDIPGIIGSLPWNSHLYVCGPDRMMRAAQESVTKHCIPPSEVHFEAFAADITGDPFEAKVANRDNKVVKVGAEETLLEVLRKEFGDDVGSSCEVGNCATCKVQLKCGKVDHRGTALDEGQKKTSMLSCVSRGVGHITIEI